jgi:hypothetical protein
MSDSYNAFNFIAMNGGALPAARAPTSRLKAPGMG